MSIKPHGPKGVILNRNVAEQSHVSQFIDPVFEQ